ncbi:MAG: hypothetical protein OHK0052_06910 [Anaerolineales bacterium]
MAHRWTRRLGEFAVRIEADDLTGLLKRGIKVEPGTNAMLIERGVNRGIVPAGEYTLGTLGQRVRDWFSGDIPERVTILLADVTPTDLEFHLGGVFTKDPLRIGFSIRLQVEIENPTLFLVNLLKGSERLTVDDLRRYLYPEVTQYAERWVRQHAARQLAENYDLRDELALGLEEALRKTFAQSGLRFLQIRAVEFNLESLEKVQGDVSKAVLIDHEMEAQMLRHDAELRKAQTDLRQQEDELGLERERALKLEAARLNVTRAQNENARAKAKEELDALEATERLRAESGLRMTRQRSEIELELETLRANTALALERLRARVTEEKQALELQGKQNYERLQKEYDLLKMAEELRTVEMEEQRAQYFARLKRATQSKKIEEVRSESELEALLYELDTESVLRNKDRQDLLQTWRENQQDHERARAFLMAKADAEQQYELRAAELKRRRDLDTASLDLELELARKRAIGEMQLRADLYEAELRRRREQEDFDRRQRREQQEYEFDLARRQDEYAREKAKADHNTSTTIRVDTHRIELQEDLDELELGYKGLQLMAENRERKLLIEWEDERRRKDHEWESKRREFEMKTQEEFRRAQFDAELKQRELDFQLTRERDQREFELTRERDRQRHEEERLKLISAMGPEALISVSGAEQARLLADLQKTQALKGMSAEEILALSAEKSPEVARAFQEKFRALAAGEVAEKEREMYERILAQDKTAQQAYQQLLRDQTARDREDALRREQYQREDAMRRERDQADNLLKASNQGKDSVDRAIDAMKGIAQSFASNQPQPAPQQPPIIINTPSGGYATPPHMVYGGGIAASTGAPANLPPIPEGYKACPTCAKHIPYEARFCLHCGHKFEGVA